MDRETRVKNAVSMGVIALCLTAITVLFAVFLLQRREPDGQETLHDGFHILMLLPGLKDQTEEFRTEARRIADRYNLQVEVMSLATVSAQQQMLSLVPFTEVDAVLLWAVSDMDEDYATELRACREAEIPVVLIDHDFVDKDLRDSYIGSGMNSELMVINQTLWMTDSSAPVLIGGFSHSGSGDTYELLVMRKGPPMEFNADRIVNERLRAFVEAPPNGYSAAEYIEVRTDGESTAALNMQLIETLREQEPVRLFFSLDESLTNALAMALESGRLSKEQLHTVIGYGGSDELIDALKSGMLDELIISDVLYSSTIGLRYLNDLLRDFHVPSTLDSGVKLIT